MKIFTILAPFVAGKLVCDDGFRYAKRSKQELFCEGEPEVGETERCLCERIDDEKTRRAYPGGHCVKQSDCREWKLQTAACPSNQIWDPCEVCHQSCGEPKLCKGLLNPDGSCSGGCACPKKMQWDNDAEECVLEADCPKPDPECPSNQIWSDCAVCHQDCGEPIRCMGLLINGECPGGCVCPKGTQWYATQERCIPDEQCEICDANMVWHHCDTDCPETCQNHGAHGGHPGGFPHGPHGGHENEDPHGEHGSHNSPCTMQCISRCKCAEGFVRVDLEDGFGECVLPEDCAVECPANSHWDECDTACPESCQNHGPHGGHPGGNPHGPHGGHDNDDPHGEHGTHNEPCTEQCISRCACDEGFVLNEANDECVALEDCPVCPSNKIWAEGVFCFQNCGDPKRCMGLLPPDGELPWSCVCPEGTQWDQGRNGGVGLCVPDAECPEICTGNTVWDHCDTACPETCEKHAGHGGHPEDKPHGPHGGHDHDDPHGEHGSHLSPCTLQCISRCKCAEGFVINDETGECIAKDQCPVCRSNSSWNECASACPETCQNHDDHGGHPGGEPHGPHGGHAGDDPHGPHGGHTSPCIKPCVPSCECDSGFVLDDVTGNCVEKEQCTQTCPANEVWKTCGSACPETCQNHAAHGGHPGAKPGGPHGPHGGHSNDDPHGPHGTHLDCTRECVAGCFCEKGFIRDETTNLCVEDCGICPPHSDWNMCGSACPETCQNHGEHGGHPGDNPHGEHGGHPDGDPHGPHGSHTSPCKMNCVPQCVCHEGFVWDETTDTCVERDACPVSQTCPDGQVWSECPLCTHNCGEREVCIFLDMCPEGQECGCPVKAQCVCEDSLNFRMDPETGECHHWTECGVCPGPNEHRNRCMSACETTCQNQWQNIACTMQCVNGCDCDDGFIRDERSGECIPASQCPLPSCGKNEVWNSCQIFTEETCDRATHREHQHVHRRSDGHDHSTGAPPMCQGHGCECAARHVRHNGFCIPEVNCPTCGDNAEWKDCGFSCGPQCTFPQGMCSLGAPCIPGCFCKTGFTLDHDDNCYPDEQCQTKECRENEVWKKCATNCEATCLAPNPECDKKCAPPQCQCADGFTRDENGNCIQEIECPPLVLECGENTIADSSNCECLPGHQKHRDGNCYAFLNFGEKTCLVAELPFIDQFIGKKCREFIKVKGKCKLQCAFDKKGRTRALPKSAFIGCKPAINPDGDVIGSQFDYGNLGFNFFGNTCGIGCGFELLSAPHLMGPSAHSIDCVDEDGDGIIELSSKKSCKMQCKAGNEQDWLRPKKAFKCLCQDHDRDGDSKPDGRRCEWQNLESNPAKVFDKKFWQNQQKENPDTKCSSTFTV